jgi:hypothetical protein
MISNAALKGEEIARNLKVKEAESDARSQARGAPSYSASTSKNTKDL